MKAVREMTTTKTVESTYSGKDKPKYKTGQWLVVYCGRDEGHAFVVKGIRYNLDANRFEYLRDSAWGKHWLGENMVTDSHRSSHYDSQGYCDNPGRGY